MQEPIVWCHFGLCAYGDALRAQEAHWRARCEGGADVCLTLEHPPTVTLGRRATDGDLRVSRAALAAQGIACVASDRGGYATYHGPGQLVLYPIVHLRARSRSVPEFVWILEQIMIEVAGHFGVATSRDARGRGVWTPRGKLGAVGIRVRQHVTTHGLALNVDPDLHPFSLIVPCGMPDAPVTSLARESGRPMALITVLPVVRSIAQNLLDARPAAAQRLAEAQL